MKNRGFILLELSISLIIFSLLVLAFFRLETTFSNYSDLVINRFNNLNIGLNNFNQMRIDLINGTENLLNYKSRVSGSNWLNEFSLNLIGFKNIVNYSLVDWSGQIGKENCSDSNVGIDWSKNINLYNYDFSISTSSKASFINSSSNGLILGLNSTSSSDSDINFINKNEDDSLSINSSLNTGPGLNSLIRVGWYGVVINTSVNSQLQIIDFSNQNSPQVILNYKIPGSSSSNPSLIKKIYYHKGLLFIGTEKRDGPELLILDISTYQRTLNPTLVFSYEIGSVINDIKIIGNNLLLATPISNSEIMIFNMGKNDFLEIKYVKSIDIPGSLGNGKSIAFSKGDLVVGRTYGNNELVLYKIEEQTAASSTNTTSTGDINLVFSDSKKIGESVNKILTNGDIFYLITGGDKDNFQVWKNDNSKLVKIKSLSVLGKAEDFSCFVNQIYIINDSNKPIFKIIEI